MIETTTYELKGFVFVITQTPRERIKTVADITGQTVYTIVEKKR